MTRRSFDDHLASLAEYYKAELDGIPTGDQILSGILTRPGVELTVDHHLHIIGELVEEINIVWTDKFNILVEAKMNRMIDWMLDHQPFEFAVLTMKMVGESKPLSDHLSKLRRYDELSRHIIALGQ